jgi:hypothetical protein
MTPAVREQDSGHASAFRLHDSGEAVRSSFRIHPSSFILAGVRPLDPLPHHLDRAARVFGGAQSAFKLHEVRDPYGSIPPFIVIPTTTRAFLPA